MWSLIGDSLPAFIEDSKISGNVPHFSLSCESLACICTQVIKLPPNFVSLAIFFVMLCSLSWFQFVLSWKFMHWCGSYYKLTVWLHEVAANKQTATASYNSRAQWGTTRWWVMMCSREGPFAIVSKAYKQGSETYAYDIHEKQNQATPRGLFLWVISTSGIKRVS